MKLFRTLALAALVVVSNGALAQSISIPGATPSSEFLISTSGSYKLDGNRFSGFGFSQTNLTVRSVIRIQANDVTIDLGGHTIGYATTSCNSSSIPVTCSVPTSGGAANSRILHGISVAPGVRNVTIRNGKVVGTWDDAIQCGEQCVIENISIRNSNGRGIHALKGATVRNVTVESTVGAGLQVSEGSIVNDVIVRYANNTGVWGSIGSRLSNIVVSDVGMTGIVISDGSLNGCTVSRIGIQVGSSGSTGVDASGSNIENCSVNSARIGVALLSGAALRNSTIVGASVFGVSGSSNSSISNVTMSSVNASSPVSGVTSLGGNMCNGVSC